jgi:hypothetical protein
MLQARFGDSVRHVVFLHSPLKDASIGAAFQLQRAKHGSDAASDATKRYLKAFSTCRKRLLALLDCQRSRPSDVAHAWRE